MAKARLSPKPTPSAEVIDFHRGIVEACPPQTREELRVEMDLLTEAFAHADDPVALRRMANALLRGRIDDPAERRHARRLSAMLQLKARALVGEEG
ncbi:MAG: hypothetical protein ABW042_02035 [Phenylobacterium sp.]